MGAGASVEGDAPKPKFIYLPVVGRGEQIRLLAAEHGIDYETVLPAGFGGEYNWAEQAPHGTLPALETTEGFALGDSAAIVEYILEKTPDGPLTPKDTKSKCLAKDAWNFCNDYYGFFLSPMHDVIMNHVGHRVITNLHAIDQTQLRPENPFPRRPSRTGARAATRTPGRTPSTRSTLTSSASSRRCTRSAWADSRRS